MNIIILILAIKGFFGPLHRKLRQRRYHKTWRESWRNCWGGAVLYYRHNPAGARRDALSF